MISESRTPIRSKAWMPVGWIACVESVSLGKRSLSTRQTRRPSRASMVASGAPAQRAPTTITSKDSFIRSIGPSPLRPSLVRAGVQVDYLGVMRRRARLIP